MKLLLFLFFFVSTAYGNGFESLVSKFKGAKSVYISFKQETYIPVAGDRVTLYRGEILYRRPLKFLWRYTWGSRMEIVSDGEFIETFFDDGSCQFTPLKEGLELFPLLLLVDSPNAFFGRFKLVEDKVDRELETVRFVSKEKGSFFREFDLYVEKGSLKSLQAIQHDGTRELFRIESLNFDLPLKDSLFRLKRCRERPAEAGRGGYHGNWKEGG